MKRALVFLGLAVVAFVAFVGYRIVTRSGMLKQIASHRQGECRVIEGIVGGEDVTIDRETMTAYISADDRRATEKPARPPACRVTTPPRSRSAATSS
jgi:hypothetical protein